MVVTYSAYAVERMLERKISVQEIEVIISNPDGVIKQSSKKAIYFRRIKKRKDAPIAAVIVEEKPNSFHVITVLINFEVRT